MEIVLYDKFAYFSRELIFRNTEKINLVRLSRISDVTAREVFFLGFLHKILTTLIYKNTLFS